jgi:hypothetical protein
MYKKYLKYKFKYLDAKRASKRASYIAHGGDGKTNNTPTISLLATHNGRIKCLLDSLHIKTRSREKFKYGAVLELKLSRDLLSLDLIHGGYLPESYEQGPDNYVYFIPTTIKHFRTGNVYNAEPKENENIFRKYELRENDELVQIRKSLNLDKYTFDTPYVFYIINQGYYNNSAKMGISRIKLLDPELSDDLSDRQMIRKIGRWLKNYLHVNRYLTPSTESLIYLFASDLIRSYKTLFRIWREISVSTQGCAFILPCSHELTFTKSTADLITKKKQNCDANQLLQDKENKISCSIDTCLPHISQHKKHLVLDWEYYNKFYGDGTRDIPGKLKKHCRDTNVIEQILYIITSKLKCKTE